MMGRIALLLTLNALVLSAADFEDYQAARAVIGQASFSSREKSLSPLALSVSKGSLYVADSSSHLIAFDLSRLGAAQSTGCAVCLTTPQLTTHQSVFDGIAAVASNRHHIAVADPKSHSVMIWNGGSVLTQPSLVLSGFVNPTAVALDNQRLFIADSGAHHVFIWNQVPSTGTQPPDVTLGVAENFDVPAADTIQSPSALASDGQNLYVADAAAHRVLIFSAADLAAPAFVNAATLAAGPLAAGTLIFVDHPPGSATVFLDGAPLRVTDSNGDQLQVQIPYDLNNASSGSLWLQNTLENGANSTTRAAAVHFTSASPGIFAFGVKEPRTGLLLHAPAGAPLGPDNPAKPSELLIAWATGLGPVSSNANSDGSFDVLAPVRASLNGVGIDVVTAVLPAEATGVYEVQLRLPPDLPSGTASLVLSQNESKSNTVTLLVQTP